MLHPHHYNLLVRYTCSINILKNLFVRPWFHRVVSILCVIWIFRRKNVDTLRYLHAKRVKCVRFHMQWSCRLAFLLRNRYILYIHLQFHFRANILINFWLVHRTNSISIAILHTLLYARSVVIVRHLINSDYNRYSSVIRYRNNSQGL